MSLKEEIQNTRKYLKAFKQKKKHLRAKQLNITYCNKMIPFLMGRLEGLSFHNKSNHKIK